MIRTKVKGDELMRKTVVKTLGMMTLIGMFMTGCNNVDETANQAPATNSETSSATNTTEATNAQTNTTTQGNTNTQNNGQITEDEAKKIALAHAGVKESDVTSIRAVQEKEDGRSVYEVKFYTDKKKYDYEITIDDGEVVKAESESRASKNQSSTTQSQITEDKAINLVLDRVDGATKDMVSIHQEVDDGITVYEGTLIHNNTEYEFEINASTGEFIAWEQEAFN